MTERCRSERSLTRKILGTNGCRCYQLVSKGRLFSEYYRRTKEGERTSEQSTSNFDRLSMMGSAVEKCHPLIKDAGGRNNRRNLGHWLPPVANCLLVMLII
jgi:hypothetical protein